MSNWTKTSDQLPQDGTYVLAVSYGGLYHVARTYESGIEKGKIMWMDIAGDYNRDYFEYWMPLPK